MSRTRAAHGGFRPTAGRRGGAPLSPAALVAVLAISAALVAGLVTAAAVARPSHAKSFDLFAGSLFLDDNRAPVAVDLTDGRPTIRLVDANAQVHARSESQLDLVGLAHTTLLLNVRTGEFNLVDATGFVVKTQGGGVALPPAAGASGARAVASGDAAYIVQSTARGSAVYLVNQATVEAARAVDAKVTPRASATVGPVSRDAGAATAAGGDLWLLTGSGTSRVITQLSVPQGSRAGATLTTTRHGAVSGVAALASTTTPGSAPGTGTGAVAVATADQVRVFTPNAPDRTLPVTGLVGVDRILPASNAQGTLEFLYHAAGGWSVVAVPAVRGELAGPRPLSAIPAGASLAPPALSNGVLYTMDRGAAGTLWQIAGGEAQPVTGAAQYPTMRSVEGTAQEAADFRDAQVLARGPRVIFNSPDHVLALTVFADDSHPPVTVDKSAAVDLQVAGGAAAIVPNVPAKGPAPSQHPNPVVAPAAPIDNKARCANTTQLPHIPAITQATPGSRSVLVRWTYPLLDSQDCMPSTYTVSVALVGKGPRPPGHATVQGQTGVQLTGLYPDTHYKLTVTAFINGQGTPSEPVEITTGPEGPAAPTGVHTSVDSAGNWTITWHACGDAAKGCVPAATWTVQPTFCDGAGLATPPAPLTVGGDPTLSTFTAKFRGSSATLGRGLSFSVQGTSADGAVGAVTSDHACSYSWRPPNGAAITLHASQPEQPELGDTTSSTFTLSLGSDPVATAGGIGAQFTYQLLSGGDVVQTRGPTSDTTVTFDGIAAGVSYQGRVTVAPPRHPEAAVTIGPVTVSVSSPWPALTASAAMAVDPANPANGTLSVSIAGVSSAAARGETFDLTNSSLVCGSTTLPLGKAGFDPATDKITAPVNLAQQNGSCTVTVQLVEDAATATKPPIFGGALSPVATATVTAPAPPGALDFAASWDHSDGTWKVNIKATNPLGVAFAGGWAVTLSDGGATPCGTASARPPTSIAVAQPCLDAAPPDSTKWSVTISYQYIWQPAPTKITVAIQGTAPSPPPTSPPSGGPSSSESGGVSPSVTTPGASTTSSSPTGSS